MQQDLKIAFNSHVYIVVVISPDYSVPQQALKLTLNLWLNLALVIFSTSPNFWF